MICCQADLRRKTFGSRGTRHHNAGEDWFCDLDPRDRDAVISKAAPVDSWEGQGRAGSGALFAIRNIRVERQSRQSFATCLQS
jgi:hypothetical protein